jgi:hypothetical protein
MSGSLPLRLPLEQLQVRWANVLNPLLASPLADAILLPPMKLVTGSNTINHLLGQAPSGWIPIFHNGWAQIYDTQSANPIPQSTLLLTVSANVTVSLLVF